VKRDALLKRLASLLMGSRGRGTAASHEPPLSTPSASRPQRSGAWRLATRTARRRTAKSPPPAAPPEAPDGLAPGRPRRRRCGRPDQLFGSGSHRTPMALSRARRRAAHSSGREVGRMALSNGQSADRVNKQWAVRTGCPAPSLAPSTFLS